MAQVVERSLWEREVPSSSLGAPIFFMAYSFPLNNVGNFIHTKQDVEVDSFVKNSKVYLSKVFTPSIPFTRLMISANFMCTTGNLLVELQVFSQGKWSDFYKIGQISSTGCISFPSQEDTFAKVRIDELCLKNPATSYKWRLTLDGDGKITNLVTSWCAQKELPSNQCEYNFKELLPFELKNPISQMQVLHPDARRICSPTSLCMALNLLGKSTEIEDTLKGCYDANSNIYGNWFFNIAYAGKKDVKANFWRIKSLEELENFLKCNSLVVASIAYEPGDLLSAPLERTAGHLVLILGLKQDKILVADPAASTNETVVRWYDCKQFEKCWLHHKDGACYVVRNHEKIN